MLVQPALSICGILVVVQLTAGKNRVAVDMMRTKIHSSRSRQCYYCTLGSRVRRCSCESKEAEHRADIDDGSDLGVAFDPGLAKHMCAGILAAQECSSQVDAADCVKLIHGGLPDRSGLSCFERDACIIHHAGKDCASVPETPQYAVALGDLHIKPSELLHCL